MRKPPEGGGLQINRKIGQEIFLFVNGVMIRLYLARVQDRKATIGIVADRKYVAVVRGEYMEKEKA